MKKILFLGFFLIGFATASTAQQKLISAFPNGWHKFEIDGIAFDVEIQAGSIVQGNATYPDGAKYSGSWAGNQFSGSGTLTWANGDRYEGKFSSGRRNGHGTMYWKNGDKYGGKWRNDVRQGKGKMWFSDGRFVKGVWDNDKLVSTKGKKSEDKNTK